MTEDYEIIVEGGKRYYKTYNKKHKMLVKIQIVDSDNLNLGIDDILLNTLSNEFIENAVH